MRFWCLLIVLALMLGACSSSSSSNNDEYGPPLNDGNGAGVVCESDCAIPEYLPSVAALQGVSVRVRRDTAIVSFEGDAAGRDYRIYVQPEQSDVMVDSNGALSIQNAVYRCGGDRPLPEFEGGISGEVHFYDRSENESLLGYVYLFEGDGRMPVYALGDPNARADTVTGSYFDAERLRYYTTDKNKRDELIALGWRDDGIVFYVPSASSEQTSTLYRYESNRQAYSQDRRFVLLLAEGPEYEQRSGDDDAKPIETLFPIYKEAQPDTVALHRVLYGNADIHDVLAAGEARYQRILHQGNSPIWELQWPGLTERTTLIVEALDEGCPFQAFLAPQDHEAVDHVLRYTTIATLQTESSTGEAFVNGQFDASNRPQPIARAAVVVEPAPDPDMDWFDGFANPITPDQFELIDEDYNNGNEHLRSELYDVDFNNTHNPVRLFGTMQGEFWVAFADREGGVNGRFRFAPLQMAMVSGDSYLHVSMEADLASTGRRYPQLMVSTLPPPIQRDLEQGETVVLQTFGDRTEIQLQYCDHRTWDVNNQCPMLSVYGRELSDYEDDTSPWAPQHAPAELAAFDRRGKFDLFLSTTHAYVFFENKPYSCSVLPGDGLPAGDVSVNFGTVLYHSGIDEGVVYGPHEYLGRVGFAQTNRHFDNLGFKNRSVLPQWNEHIPCVEGSWEVRN
ncbi:MAG: hypothetical protein IPJ88_03180 [Myxococcales bacterium]|nr:MAG: hypothetical protein IPJ88_03180 [Myxococcales bacterium]